MKSLFKDAGDGFAELQKREMGLSQCRSFTRRISASEDIMKRIDLYGKLIGHEGCVNAVEFDSTGDLLVSGSDDLHVKFWNWETSTEKLSYPSGHMDNIFQTKFMPFTDRQKIITSAGDGQVRLGLVSENSRVNTKMLGKHRGSVYKLAVEPGSPHVFFSCGLDGFVQHFDLRSSAAAKLFRCSSFMESNNQHSTSIGLNAIVIDPRNPNYFALGGSDEYARVYDIRKYQRDSSSSIDKPVNTFCPRHLVKTNNVHITGLAYSHRSELLVSYNDELIYLFEKNMGLGPSPLSGPSEDPEKVEEAQVYRGHRNSKTYKGVSFFGPNDEYVMSGSDCGHIFIWKRKGGKLVRVMVGDMQTVNQLEPHPFLPFFATCGIEKNVKLWAPIATDTLPLPDNINEIMGSNRQGREDHSRVMLTPDVIMHLLRLQRRRPMAHIERIRTGGDTGGDDEDEEGAYVLRFSNGNEEGLEGSPTECNIA